jgi:hypothetical protein
MSELTRLRTASFRDSRQLDGCTFTVNGGTYRGILSAGIGSNVPVSGGFLQDYDKSLDYLPSEIALAVGDKITTDGVTYRVLTVNGDGAGINTAQLGTVNK